MIQPGAALPDVTLYEFIDEPTEGCALGPNPVSVTQAAQGKTIALFGLPGAFTPTCSERHAPASIEGTARSERSRNRAAHTARS